MLFHVLLCILRFIAHVPLWMGAAWASTAYNNMRKHKDVVALAPGSHTLASIGIPGILLWIVAVYNMFTFGFAIFISAPGAGVLMAVDGVIVALVGTAVGLQTKWVPMRPTDCKRYADTFANGYFKALAAANLKTFKPGKDSDGNKKKKPTTKGACNDMYLVFVFEVFTLVLFVLSCLTYVGVFYEAARPARTSRASRVQKPLRAALKILLWPLVITYLGVYWTICQSVCCGVFITKFINRTMTQHSRGLLHADRKAPAANVSKHDDEHVELKWLDTSKVPAVTVNLLPDSPAARPVPPEPARTLDLPALIDIYPIFESLVQRLHGSDIVSLTQVSHRIRATLATHGSTQLLNNGLKKTVVPVPVPLLASSTAVAPPGTNTPSASVGLILRSVCADPTSRGTCFACAIPLCSGCDATKPHVLPLRTEFHLRNCQPFCHRCFHREICSPRDGGGWRSAREGHCMWNEEATRRVCGNCARLSAVQCRDLGDRRLRREMKGRIGREEERCCGRCGRGVWAWGPRWWVCRACRRECRMGVIGLVEWGRMSVGEGL